MEKEIVLNGRKISYQMQYKQVKNINLRIKADSTVYVSAHRSISTGVIEAFLISKSGFIINALDKYSSIQNADRKQYFNESEIYGVITAFCRKVYPYYEKRGVQYPEIKMRSMVSCWGSCHPRKCVLTFNSKLIYAPRECVEYVVWHEFTHFLQANHSQKFYEELEKVCPGWKESRKKLKEIPIR